MQVAPIPASLSLSSLTPDIRTLDSSPSCPFVGLYWKFTEGPQLTGSISERTGKAKRKAKISLAAYKEGLCFNYL